jgi:hypothetical protein
MQFLGLIIGFGMPSLTLEFLLTTMRGPPIKYGLIGEVSSITPWRKISMSFRGANSEKKFEIISALSKEEKILFFGRELL